MLIDIVQWMLIEKCDELFNNSSDSFKIISQYQSVSKSAK